MSSVWHDVHVYVYICMHCMYVLMYLIHRVQIIARLADGSRFHEFKSLYAPTIVTGFMQLYGMQVGVVANNGILYSESSLKVQGYTIYGYIYIYITLKKLSWVKINVTTHIHTYCMFIIRLPYCKGRPFYRALLSASSATSLSAEHYGVYDR